MDDSILQKFPKTRPKLPRQYAKLFEEEHLANRRGNSYITLLAKKFESWMHKKVAKLPTIGAILEIGAGTLNHIPYEKLSFNKYDIVEIAKQFYKDSPNLKYINEQYNQIAQVPIANCYDKIISIAVLEHADNLPEIIAHSALMLKENGIMQHAIPTEGSLLWEIAWRLTTGLSFKLRTGLNYKTIFETEHINNAHEIIQIFKCFFKSVKINYYPLPFFHVSCYTYIEATNPLLQKCKNYINNLKHQ